jgi:hypothetical protein
MEPSKIFIKINGCIRAFIASGLSQKGALDYEKN